MKVYSIKQATEVDEVWSRWLSALSSMFYLFGTTFLFIYLCFELGAPSQSKFFKQQIHIYFVIGAYGWLVIHSIVEIAIDLSSTRRLHAHGRYARVYMSSRFYGMDLMRVNLAQSLTFLVASLFQAVAFFELSIGDIEQYVALNFAASCLWIISSALILVARAFFWIQRGHTHRGMIEKFANAVYMVATILWFCDALNQLDQYNGSQLGDILQDASMALLVISGGLYMYSAVLLLSCDSEKLVLSGIDSSPLNEDGYVDGDIEAGKLKSKSKTKYESDSSTACTNSSNSDNSENFDHPSNKVGRSVAVSNHTTHAVRNNFMKQMLTPEERSCLGKGGVEIVLMANNNNNNDDDATMISNISEGSQATKGTKSSKVTTNTRATEMSDLTESTRYPVKGVDNTNNGNPANALPQIPEVVSTGNSIYQDDAASAYKHPTTNDTGALPADAMAATKDKANVDTKATSAVKKTASKPVSKASPKTAPKTLAALWSAKAAAKASNAAVEQPVELKPTPSLIQRIQEAKQNMIQKSSSTKHENATESGAIGDGATDSGDNQGTYTAPILSDVSTFDASLGKPPMSPKSAKSTSANAAAIALVQSSSGVQLSRNNSTKSLLQEEHFIKCMSQEDSIQASGASVTPANVATTDNMQQNLDVTQSLSWNSRALDGVTDRPSIAVKNTRSQSHDIVSDASEYTDCRITLTRPNSFKRTVSGTSDSSGKMKEMLSRFFGRKRSNSKHITFQDSFDEKVAQNELLQDFADDDNDDGDNVADNGEDGVYMA